MKSRGPFSEDLEGCSRGLHRWACEPRRNDETRPRSDRRRPRPTDQWTARAFRAGTERAWRSVAATVLATATVAAGFAFAQPRSTPIGTGVVVIDTNLAYQGGEAAGTGMVLAPSGEILTNNHVIRGATTIKVVVPGTGHSYTAKVIGYDVTDDVAVLQASAASNLKTVTLGTSSGLKIGQLVKAIGNAHGTGSLVKTVGQITGLSRTITVNDESGGTGNAPEPDRDERKPATR